VLIEPHQEKKKKETLKLNYSKVYAISPFNQVISSPGSGVD